MMRNSICVIGSSHSVCMRKYFNNSVIEAPDWYVSAGRGFLSLEAREGQISTRHPGAQQRLALTYGGSTLRIDDHEAFFVIGDAPRLNGLVHVYDTHRLFQHDRWRSKYLISSGCFGSILEDDIKNSTTFKIVKAIRAHSDAPVMVSHLPLPSVCAISAPVKALTKATLKWLDLARNGYALDLLAANLDAARAVFEPLNVRIMGPPAETITEDGLCHDIYMKTDDYTHKNARYGELMWRDYLSA